MKLIHLVGKIHMNNPIMKNITDCLAFAKCFILLSESPILYKYPFLKLQTNAYGWSLCNCLDFIDSELAIF